MATERVARTDQEWLEEMARQQREEKTWKPTSERNPAERHDSKLRQAEMLVHCISGSDDFDAVHPAIRNGVIWLLAELLTEAREAKEEADEIAFARRRAAAVQEVA